MTPTFWTLDKETRRRHYDRSVQAGDVVRPSRTPDIWLVSSDTLSKKYGRPVFWRVDVRTATCGCEGWRRYGTCRHCARAIMAAWEARQTRPANVIDFPVAA